MFEISRFTEKDADQWFELWKGYQEDENLSDEEVRAEVNINWPRVLHDENCHTHALVLSETKEFVGFTNFVSTWSRTKPKDECYLCDLFVMPEHQGKGGGRALINSVVDFSRENNLNKVTWLTQSHNKKAQKLYDSFSKGEEWIRYKVKI